LTSRVGRSSKGNGLYSPSNYAVFIKWVAGNYVKGAFVLIGHSLGGAAALCYAADYPDDLKRLLLVDAAGILHRTALAKEQYLMNDDGPAGEFDEFARSMLDHVTSDERAKKLEQSLQDASMRRVALGGDPKKIASPALMLEDFGAAVDRVRTPALLIWGGNDRVAPIRTAKALMGRLPDARLVLIPQAGHTPMLEQPEQFNRIVMEELASRETATSEATTAPLPRREIPPAPVVRYDHQRGLSLTGSYKSIELNHCSDVRIAGVTAERSDVVNSDVIIENSRIRGTDVALFVKNSEIIATHVSIEADTAIDASSSRLDLAGVKLRGRKTAVATDRRAMLLFSISHSDSPIYSGPLHGSRKITQRSPL
jgi:pimeloyl-ACP methyl ester carboxylesterase